MIEIVGVKFNGGSKVYYFDPCGTEIEAGTMVLVETSRSVEMGKVVTANKMVEEESIVAPLKPIIRIATEEDLKQAAENKEKEKEAFEIASAKIAEHNLDMKLVGAEYTFDRTKILFYFTADGRVDFRDLVKSLAGIFRTRIELRQIGVRDEARQLGSIGICGRFLCCSTFLNDFHPVSIKMAKEQGLSLNPTKISGVCGRLMCCLQYEQNAYDDMLKRMPSRGDRVETPDGEGVVVDTATLKGRIKVKFTDSNGDMVKINEYVLGDFNPLEKGKPVRLERPADKSDEDISIENIPEDIAVSEEKTEQEQPRHSGEGRRNNNKRRRPNNKGGANKKEKSTAKEKGGDSDNKNHQQKDRNRSNNKGGRSNKKNRPQNGGTHSGNPHSEGESRSDKKPGGDSSSGNGGYGSGYDL